MSDSPQTFVERHTTVVAPLHREIADAYWKLATTGDPQYAERSERLELERAKIYSNPQEFQLTKHWHEEGGADGSPLARQIWLLHLTYLAYQDDPARIAEKVRLEVELHQDSTRYRAPLRGKPVADNEIEEVLHHSEDNDLRREAWEASKTIGPVVAPKIRRLAALRNATAQGLGFRDFYPFALALHEIDEADLLRRMEELDRLSAGPYARAKARLDVRLAARFRVPPSDLSPWHYADPFFQTPPPQPELNLDPLFHNADVEALATRTYDDLGMDIRDLIAHSDLYERPQKNQHAFCISVDREGDVRVLCNLRPNARWMGTLLHEFGHAVYDKYIPRSLPFFLRTPSHIMTTEAVALLQDRLVQDPDWLGKYSGADPAGARKLAGGLADNLRLRMLIFTRWVLVMVHFERALYANPEDDLDRIWWGLVERYQDVKTPPGREKLPDWASKTHIANSPDYYHNYLLGELIASQLEAGIRAAGPRVSRSAGEYLRDRLFALGSQYDWQETVKRATGQPLTPAAWAAQFKIQ